MGATLGLMSSNVNLDLLYFPNSPEKSLGKCWRRFCSCCCSAVARCTHLDATSFGEIDSYKAFLIFFVTAAKFSENVSMHEKCVTGGVDTIEDFCFVMGMDRPSHVMRDWA